MEKLKSMVPSSLREKISKSSTEELPHTCHSLLQSLLNLPQFHHMIEDLACREKGLCGKNKETAFELKQKANHLFSMNNQLQEALSCYSQAIRVAPIDAVDQTGKNLLATLYVNRASVFHKIGHPKECLRDCKRALKISVTYSKAWYRRGKANASLGNYEDAMNDLRVAQEMEPSLGGKRQIEAELNIYLDKYKATGGPSVHNEEKNWRIMDEPYQAKLQQITTPDKGRAMAAVSDIMEGSLIHTEEPYAATIFKHYRDSHCSYCLNELPMDKVPCTSCSIPLFCSDYCQVLGGGQGCRNTLKNVDLSEELCDSIKKYICEVTHSNDSELNVGGFFEHKYECGGVNWPAVLPSEIVLAGRIVLKSIFQKICAVDISNLTEAMGLCHSYMQMPSESKLELHVYSAILLCCLQRCCEFEIPGSGVAVSQIIILISQIRVNSLAIVRIGSKDNQQKVDQFGKSPCIQDDLTTNIEQTTEYVQEGCPLELSYGPQVGQWHCKDRIKFLEEKYTFQCHCGGCSKLSLSDLVINAFRCVNPSCPGVILDSHVISYEQRKIHHLRNVSKVNRMVSDEINEVACLEPKQITGSLTVVPGLCLKCGACHDLVSSQAAVNKAWICIKMLHDAITSGELSPATLSDVSRSLHILRSSLHAYNRTVAEAEDIFAQAFCVVGEFQSAMNYCKTSINILEKLYGPNHIVIGNELVKLFTIQLLSSYRTAVETGDRLDKIFSRYYGPHADMVFPYLQIIRREAKKLV